jgi:ribosomal protein L3 glutamine methyltransferase
LEPWIPNPVSVESALDLCTGSGCLAILLAHYYPNADVDATDISSDALAVAQRNVAEHGLQDRINLIRSDLLSNLTEKTYPLIISNPPYVTAMAMEELPAEYSHEPQIALAGGDDGLDAVRTIVTHSARFLNPDGVLVVEVGRNREGAEAAFPRLPFVWLETTDADAGVFLLRRDDLLAAA